MGLRSRLNRWIFYIWSETGSTTPSPNPDTWNMPDSLWTRPNKKYFSRAINKRQMAL